MPTAPADKQFLMFFIPMVLAAAGLILMIPGLFDGPGPVHLGVATALAVATVGCAVMARRFRPTARGNGED